MLKKIFASTIFLLMFAFAAQVSAMTFQQPVKIGSAGIGSGYGLRIEDATKIDAKQNGDTYTNGYAIFGDKLYLHFDDATADDFTSGSWFGSSDKNNTVQYYVFEGSTSISRLPNDSGIDMYLLMTETGGGNVTAVIGNRDGKWVKFVDTNGAKLARLVHVGHSRFGRHDNFGHVEFRSEKFLRTALSLGFVG